MIVRLAMLFLCAFALRADTFIFFDVGVIYGTPASFEQLPDTPGGPLEDTITAPPNQCLVTSTESYCPIIVASSDGLTPGSVGGFVTIGNGQPETVVDEIDYNALPTNPYYPDYFMEFFAEREDPFTGCIPSVCTDIIPATGAIQEAITIPWLNASGDVIRTDTIDIVSSLAPVIPPPTPEPRWTFLPLAGLLFLGSRLRRFGRNLPKARV